MQTFDRTPFVLAKGTYPADRAIKCSGFRNYFTLVVPIDTFRNAATCFGDFRQTESDDGKNDIASARVALQTLVMALTAIQTPVNLNQQQAPPADEAVEGNENDQEPRRKFTPKAQTKMLPDLHYVPVDNTNAIPDRQKIRFFIETLIKDDRLPTMLELFSNDNIAGFRFHFFVEHPATDFREHIYRLMLRNASVASAIRDNPKHPLKNTEGREFAQTDGTGMLINLRGYEQIKTVNALNMGVLRGYTKKQCYEMEHFRDLARMDKDTAVQFIRLDDFSETIAIDKMRTWGVCPAQLRSIMGPRPNDMDVDEYYGPPSLDQYYRFALPWTTYEVHSDYFGARFFSKTFGHHTISVLLQKYTGIATPYNISDVISENLISKMVNDALGLTNSAKTLAEKYPHDHEFSRTRFDYEKELQKVSHLLTHDNTRNLQSTKVFQKNLQQRLLTAYIGCMDPTQDIPRSVQCCLKEFAENNNVIKNANQQFTHSLSSFGNFIARLVFLSSQILNLGGAQLHFMEQVIGSVSAMMDGPNRSLHFAYHSAPGQGKSATFLLVKSVLVQGTMSSATDISTKAFFGSNMRLLTNMILYFNEAPKSITGKGNSASSKDEAMKDLMKSAMSDAQFGVMRLSKFVGINGGDNYELQMFETKVNFCFFFATNTQISDGPVLDRLMMRQSLRNMFRDGLSLLDFIGLPMNGSDFECTAAIRNFFKSQQILCTFIVKAITCGLLPRPSTTLVSLMAKDCMHTIDKVLGNVGNHVRDTNRIIVFYECLIIYFAAGMCYGSQEMGENVEWVFDERTNKWVAKMKPFSFKQILSAVNYFPDRLDATILAISAAIENIFPSSFTTAINLIMKLGCNFTSTVFSEWVTYTDNMMCVEDTIRINSENYQAKLMNLPPPTWIRHSPVDETDNDTAHAIQDRDKIFLNVEGSRPTTYATKPIGKGMKSGKHLKFASRSGEFTYNWSRVDGTDVSTRVPQLPLSGMFSVAGEYHPDVPQDRFVSFRTVAGGIDLNYIKVDKPEGVKLNGPKDLAEHIEREQNDPSKQSLLQFQSISKSDLTDIFVKLHHMKIKVPILPQYSGIVTEYEICKNFVPANLHKLYEEMGENPKQSMSVLLFQGGDCFVNVFAGQILDFGNILNKVMKSFEDNQSDGKNMIVWMQNPNNPAILNTIKLRRNPNKVYKFNNPRFVPPKAHEFFKGEIPVHENVPYFIVRDNIEAFASQKFREENNIPDKYIPSNLEQAIRHQCETKEWLIDANTKNSKCKYPEDFLFSDEFTSTKRKRAVSTIISEGDPSEEEEQPEEEQESPKKSRMAASDESDDEDNIDEDEIRRIQTEDWNDVVSLMRKNKGKMPDIQEDEPYYPHLSHTNKFALNIEQDDDGAGTSGY
jgi:hypothetical protein